MEQGAVAIRKACADAGVEWSDLQFAFGGSTAAGAADTIVSQMGLTGLQFINVVNGCANFTELFLCHRCKGESNKIVAVFVLPDDLTD